MNSPLRALPDLIGVLVLAVPAGSLATFRTASQRRDPGSRAASEWNPPELIEHLATLMTLYSAQRWLGQREFRVMRNQQPLQLTLKFQAE